jgi:hypothetical protein
MDAVTKAGVAIDRMRAAALAAALMFTANVACAGSASVVINGFTIGTSADAAVFVFAPLDFMQQVWDLRAVEGGGPQQLVSGSVPDWSNVNETAATALAHATVSSLQATDVLTQLATPIFTLEADASGANNVGTGSMISSGGFCFGDGVGFDGTSAGCNAAGELTFTVYYDLIVGLAPADSAGARAEAAAHLDIMNGAGLVTAAFSDLASTDLAGSRLGESFTYTLALPAGESAFFDLSGSVRADAASTLVAEPDGPALIAVAGLALAWMRRRTRAFAAIA